MNINRIPTLHGRRADGFFGGQIHSSVASDAWRNTEYDNRAESKAQWNKDSFQGDQHVDHWAKFIDAIEHAQQREALPMSTPHMQGNEERPPSSPRRLPRERLPSPDHARFDKDERYRMSGTPGWNRSEESDKHLGRHEHNLQQNQRESRDRSHPGHSEARRNDRTDYKFGAEEHGNQFHDRGSFSERYKNIIHAIHLTWKGENEEEKIPSLSPSLSIMDINFLNAFLFAGRGSL